MHAKKSMEHNKTEPPQPKQNKVKYWPFLGKSVLVLNNMPCLILYYKPSSTKARVVPIRRRPPAAGPKKSPQAPRHQLSTKKSPQAPRHQLSTSRPLSAQQDKFSRFKRVPKSNCDFVAQVPGLLCNRVYMYVKVLYLSRIYNKRGCITQVNIY